MYALLNSSFCQVIYGVYKSVSSTEDIFCGKHALQPVMSKSINIMFLVMETDESIHDKGFLANYIFIDGRYASYWQIMNEESKQCPGTSIVSSKHPHAYNWKDWFYGQIMLTIQLHADSETTDYKF